MYEYRVEKKVCVVETGGGLTLTEPHRFKAFVLEILENAEYEGLIVNFKNLQFIDSFGIGVIVALFKAAKEKSRPFAITEMSKNHKQLFSSVGLDKAIDIHNSDDDAITVMTIKG